MARLARVVVPGYPHHITQRGNRRQRTFFSDDDYQAYLDLMAAECQAHGVAIRAWCLMPNHVHLIAVPRTAEGLAAAIGEAHRRYTRLVNFREGWRGYLWQGRFASFVLQGRHLVAPCPGAERQPEGRRNLRWAPCPGAERRPEGRRNLRWAPCPGRATAGFRPPLEAAAVSPAAGPRR
jgi:putative transposase